MTSAKHEGANQAPARRRGRPLGTARETPLSLIETAERLFGTHGIASVPLRRINSEAKVLNKSAIAYHFGTKRRLVQAIWERRLPELEQVRAKMLVEARQQNGAIDQPLTLVSILLRPMFDLVDASGRHRYCAFFDAAVRWPQGRELRQKMMARSPSSSQAMDLLAACLKMPPAVVADRLKIGSSAFFEMIADRDEAIAQALPQEPADTFLADALAMVTAMLMRPWRAA